MRSWKWSTVLPPLLIAIISTSLKAEPIAICLQVGRSAAVGPLHNDGTSQALRNIIDINDMPKNTIYIARSTSLELTFYMSHKRVKAMIGFILYVIISLLFETWEDGNSCSHAVTGATSEITSIFDTTLDTMGKSWHSEMASKHKIS